MDPRETSSAEAQGFSSLDAEGFPSDEAQGKKRRYTERKCMREKQRRNEFNEGINRLSGFLQQVEPDLQFGRGSDGVTNRSELVNVTIRVISKLHDENESLKKEINERCQGDVSKLPADQQLDEHLPKESRSGEQQDTICPPAFNSSISHAPDTARDTRISTASFLSSDQDLIGTSLLLQHQRRLLEQMQQQAVGANQRAVADALAFCHEDSCLLLSSSTKKTSENLTMAPAPKDDSNDNKTNYKCGRGFGTHNCDGGREASDDLSDQSTTFC